jgi:catechol 2,3-dioxygenase-like lactoylglutathione lyase family enzyme
MRVEDLHHVVLDVGDLPAAEAYYRDLFSLDVAFREGEYEDEYGKVPDGLDWPAAADAGVEPGMTFLTREGFALALTAEDASEDGRLNHVALAVGDETVGEVAETARDLDCEVDEREDVVFVTDQYGVEWELNAGSPPPTCPFEDLPVDA